MNLLNDNRTAFDQLLANCQSTFPEDLCIGTVHVENIIEKLSEAFLSLDSERREELQQSASQLFYLLAELIDDDVKRCYPAIQFFSSGVEVLGKVRLPSVGKYSKKEESTANTIPLRIPKVGRLIFFFKYQKGGWRGIKSEWINTFSC